MARCSGSLLRLVSAGTIVAIRWRGGPLAVVSWHWRQRLRLLLTDSHKHALGVMIVEQPPDKKALGLMFNGQSELGEMRVTCEEAIPRGVKFASLPLRNDE